MPGGLFGCRLGTERGAKHSTCESSSRAAGRSVTSSPRSYPPTTTSSSSRADAEALRPFDGLDVQVIRGKPTHIETLRTIELRADDKFVACSDSDEQNIIACMAAKRLGGARTFCFVSKEEYYESFRRDAEGDDIVDIDEVIWPQLMLANEIARIVLVPEAIDVEVFAGGRIWLMEYRLGEDSLLVGKRVIGTSACPSACSRWR